MLRSGLFSPHVITYTKRDLKFKRDFICYEKKKKRLTEVTGHYIIWCLGVEDSYVKFLLESVGEKAVCRHMQ